MTHTTFAYEIGSKVYASLAYGLPAYGYIKTISTDHAGKSVYSVYFPVTKKFLSGIFESEFYASFKAAKAEAKLHAAELKKYLLL